MPFPEISLNNYTYDLPEEKIAQHPAPNREQAKLLIYHDRKISHTHFSRFADQIPKNSSLFFNDARVIPARIIFKRATGGLVEVFLLEPKEPVREIHLAMLNQSPMIWKCLVRNQKRWRGGELLTLQAERGVTLTAELLERGPEVSVRLIWQPSSWSFSQMVESIGKLPLPPYIDRNNKEDDAIRYQTVYSKHEGAVAAPTAGLHFTSDIIAQLKDRGNTIDFLTLYVSAGTFQPIKVARIEDHPMHSEQISISRENIIHILKSEYPVAVGTTSMRTLESIYWFGCLLEKDRDAPFFIDKDVPYAPDFARPGAEAALENVLLRLEREETKVIHGETRLFIVPGYEFQICRGLVTNFHLPGSTLMLLVAAFVGPDWKSVYNYALANDFRFLSYGDVSVLLRDF